MLREFGLWVPQPEVPSDETNPRGFAESIWAVTFNDRLLKRELIEVSDARPEAWLATTLVTMGPRPRQLLFAWLRSQCEQHDEIVIKDPRLAWFIGMWRAASYRVGARPSFVTMLRHPSQVVSSKSQRYPGPAGNTNRTAAWVNMMLFTERATRGSDRGFVAYNDLLQDWAQVIRPLGERLDLRAIVNGTADDVRRVAASIEPSLPAQHGDWDTLGVSGVIRDLAEETWRALAPMTDPAEDTTSRASGLDVLRRDFVALMNEAEGVAASSNRGCRACRAGPGRLPGRPGAAGPRAPDSLLSPTADTGRDAGRAATASSRRSRRSRRAASL